MSIWESEEMSRTAQQLAFVADVIRPHHVFTLLCQNQGELNILEEFWIARMNEWNPKNHDGHTILATSIMIRVRELTYANQLTNPVAPLTIYETKIKQINLAIIRYLLRQSSHESLADYTAETFLKDAFSLHIQSSGATQIILQVMSWWNYMLANSTEQSNQTFNILFKNQSLTVFQIASANGNVFLSDDIKALARLQLITDQPLALPVVIPPTERFVKMLCNAVDGQPRFMLLPPASRNGALCVDSILSMWNRMKGTLDESALYRVMATAYYEGSITSSRMMCSIPGEQQAEMQFRNIKPLPVDALAPYLRLYIACMIKNFGFDRTCGLLFHAFRMNYTKQPIIQLPYLGSRQPMGELEMVLSLHRFVYLTKNDDDAVTIKDLQVLSSANPFSLSNPTRMTMKKRKQEFIGVWSAQFVV